jgi:hypothetical protein
VQYGVSNFFSRPLTVGCIPLPQVLRSWQQCFESSLFQLQKLLVRASKSKPSLLPFTEDTLIPSFS